MYWLNTNWASLLTDLCVIQLWQSAGSNFSPLWYTLTFSCSSLYSHLYQLLTCCRGMPTKLHPLYTCTHTELHSLHNQQAKLHSRSVLELSQFTGDCLIFAMWSRKLRNFHIVSSCCTFLQCLWCKKANERVALLSGFTNMLCQGATFAKITWKHHPWLVRLGLT